MDNSRAFVGSADDDAVIELVRMMWGARRMILALTLAAAVLAGLIALALPKTYEAESVIQLGNIAGTPIQSPYESKNILLSSTIIEPALKEAYPNGDRSMADFLEYDLDVGLVQEKMSVANVYTTPYVRIVTRARSPEVALGLNRRIIDDFLNYVKPEYDAVTKTDSERLGQLQDRIANSNADVKSITREIGNLSPDEVSSEGIGKTIMLKGVLASYEDALNSEEQDAYTLRRSIALTRGYMIVTQPELPQRFSKPNIPIVLAAGLIAGFCASLLVAAFQNMTGKRRRGR